MSCTTLHIKNINFTSMMMIYYPLNAHGRKRNKHARAQASMLYDLVYIISRPCLVYFWPARVRPLGLLDI